VAEGFEAGAAYIRISPDTEDFAGELKAKVEAAAAGAEGSVKVGGDDAELDAVLRDARAKLDELSGTRAEPSAGLNAEELTEGASDATARLRELGETRATAALRLDKGEFDEGADAVTEKLTVLGDTRADPVVGVEDEPAQESLAELQRQLAVLKAQKAGIEVDADASQADIKIAQVKAQIDGLRNERALASLGLDGSEFDARAEAATEKLTVLDGEKAEPRLDLDDAEFNSKLDEDKAKLSSAGSSSGRAGLFSAIGMGIGALTPGIGGAVAGLGLLGATGGLAFGGIAKALGDAHAAAQNTGQTSQQLAAQQFSNAVQVQQAQQSVTQARQQAVQDAVTSNQQIQQADMNLAETERNTAASRIQALEQVQQAQQGVQSATYSLSEANYSLGQAYQQARQQIVQLNDQLADSKLSVQAASLAVQQAEQQEQQVNASAYSTELDREQAALAVAQAKQRLQDATDQESAAQTAANQANAQGVDGSQTVIQAKQAQLQATQQLSNAQQSLKDANTNLTNTQLNNETQLKEAQMQASSAREQAAYQQRQDAQSVAQAEQNLTNTIKEQQLQAAATASTQNQAANQFLKDMAKLTPAGKAFVNQVLGLRSAFRGLEADAQNAALPGFSVLLKGISSLLPEIRTGVTGMGGAIGRMAAGLGRVLQTKSAVDVVNGLFRNGIEFMDIVGPAIGRMLGAILTVGSKQGAVTGLADLVKGIADGIAGFAKGLTPYIPALNQVFEALGKIAKALGPAFASQIGGIAKLLEPLAAFLNSKQGQPFVNMIASIVAGLVTMKGLAKLLPGDLGKAFGSVAGLLGLPKQIGESWKTVTGIPGKVTGTWDKLVSFPGKVSSAWAKAFGEGGQVPGMVSGLKDMLTGLPAKMGAVTAAIKDWGIWSQIASAATKIWAGIQAAFNIIMDANPIALVAIAIAGLTAGVIYAYKHFTWFRDAVNDVFGALKTGALFLWHNVFEPVWNGIKGVFENAWNFIYHGIGKYLLVFLGPAGMLALGAIELSQHWQQIWGDIKNWAKDAWNFIYNGFGKYLLPLLGPAGLIALGVIELSQHWQQIWGDIKSAAKTVWDWLQIGAHDVVSAVSSAWNKLESAFKAPVNFLIKTVYDGGIAKLWNDVVGAVGLGSLKLPIIAGLAHGGIVPGTDHGRDEVLIAARPEEGVLVPGAVRAIGGPPAVHALNAAHGGGGTGKPGHYSLGGIISGVAHGIVDTAKIGAALLTGNTTAFVNAASGVIGTPAAGALGQVMLAMPKSLVGDMAKALASAIGGGGGKVTPSGTVGSWFSQAAKLANAPGSWIPDLETIGMHESSDNPNAINNSDSNAAAGDPSRGIMQLIGTTFSQYHVPGTSMNIYDPIANIAAGIGYIRARYGSPANVPGIVSLAKGGPYVGYDSGGWLPPGMTAAVNLTGKPEAVLTPQQSQALSQLAAGGGAQPAPVVVNNNWYGPQMPSHEMQAEMDRRLSLQLSGG
jgi:SLT domain-containing protein